MGLGSSFCLVDEDFLFIGDDKNVLRIHDTTVLNVEELLGIHVGSGFDKDFVR